MTRHKKSDGTVTVKGVDGKIVGNIASGALTGPAVRNAAISVSRSVGEAVREEAVRVSRVVTLEHVEANRAAYVAGLDGTPQANNWQASIWAHAHEDIAENAPYATVEQREKAAEFLAEQFSTELHIYQSDRHYHSFDNDALAAAARELNAEGVADAIYEYIIENELHREEYMHEAMSRVADILDIDGEPASFIVDGIADAYGDNVTWDETEWYQSTSRREGLLWKYHTSESLPVLAKCSQADGTLLVDSVEELDMLISLSTHEQTWDEEFYRGSDFDLPAARINFTEKGARSVHDAARNSGYKGFCILSNFLKAGTVVGGVVAS